jgi:glycoprotein endo-alpha-1,2-mannosidase
MVAAPARVTPEVAAFYYPWYATPDRDGEWRHWEGNNRRPPEDVAADFYPQRGAYSSSDPAVLQGHMAEMAQAGIDLVVTSWWGRGSFEDDRLPEVLLAAANAGIRVAVHLEPYVGRSLATIASDVAYLRDLGVRDVWMYNAQRFPASGWAGVRAAMGADVRVMAQSGNQAQMKSGEFSALAATAGFDGIYTYDAVRYSPADFAAVCASARRHGLLCSPSVSLGYTALRLKPNDTQFVPRDGGARYDATWSGALDARADIVSITSHNEWHEGTQIEPAVPYCFPDGFCSPGYEGSYGVTGAAAPGAYLARTLVWSTEFRR